MHRPSSATVEVSFLDSPGVIKALRKRAQELIDQDHQVLEVLLFGSLATGNHVPGSDADLIIVLEQSEERPLDRIGPFLKWFLKAPIPVDVFAYTQQELERMVTEGNPFITRALREALRLAWNGGDSSAGFLRSQVGEEVSS